MQYHVCPTAQRRDKQSGFTLIEVLLAVLIMSMAYVTILQNFSVSMRNIFRLDEKRTSMFENHLAFEQVLFGTGGEDEDAVSEETVFLESASWALYQVATDDNELMTLKLVKK
ncbi:MAG: prepilin-type N-terminal cleavage/methylation domain-containing protein [Desulfobulbaceae bacterium]|nr:prepilin-type N-terminal cleavage/methylation domain-containing protein [Desulfobulbaceae bacterium]